MFLRLKSCVQALQKTSGSRIQIQGMNAGLFAGKTSRSNYSTSNEPGTQPPNNTERKPYSNTNRPRFNNDNNGNTRSFNRNNRSPQNRNQDQQKRFDNNNSNYDNNNRGENNRGDNNRNFNRNENQKPNVDVTAEPTQTTSSTETKHNNDSYLSTVGERQRKSYVARGENRQPSDRTDRNDRAPRQYNNHSGQPRSHSDRPHNDRPHGDRPHGDRPHGDRPRTYQNNETRTQQSQGKLVNEPRFRREVNTVDIVKRQFDVQHPEAPVVIKPASINITAEEKKVLDILAGTVKHFKLNTVLRVAGGWVRDKILGNDAGDIDIAVDNLTGVDFASLVQTYLKIQGGHNNLHIVKVNPSKSKHLETAIMHILDFEVNFNHLRSEEYEPNSRIPTSTPFGTPLQDITRRDLTINSMYYNLNTEAIEDFSGQAMADLKAGLLRTTYSAVHADRLKDAEVDPTILEDPLRAIRAVRFASRFDFKIDPLLMKSLRHADTRKSLQQLVSPERIGIELDKIFDMPTPKILRGVSLFEECELIDNIFYPITGVHKDKKFPLNLAGQRTKKFSDVFLKTPEFEVYNDLLLAAFISPVVDNKNGFKLARDLCTKLAVRSGRRDSVLHVLQMALEFMPLLDAANKEAGINPTHSYSVDELLEKYNSVSVEALGLWLRRVSSQAWAIVMYLSRLLRIQSMEEIGQYNSPNLYAHEEALIKRLNQHDFAFRTISMRPLLTGHDIMKLLELPSSPKIGYYMGKLVMWQIHHPKTTTREEAEKYLKQLVLVDDAQLQPKSNKQDKPAQ